MRVVRVEGLSDDPMAKIIARTFQPWPNEEGALLESEQIAYGDN